MISKLANLTTGKNNYEGLLLLLLLLLLLFLFLLIIFILLFIFCLYCSVSTDSASWWFSTSQAVLKACKHWGIYLVHWATTWLQSQYPVHQLTGSW